MTSRNWSNVVVWVLSVLLAILFVAAAVPKFTMAPGWETRLESWGMPGFLRIPIGLAEIAGAILLLVPALAVWGATLVGVVMLGAAATHLVHGPPTSLVLTLVLFGLAALVGRWRWHQRRG